MGATDTPSAFRFTVAQFSRMGEAGIFAEDERIELIDGEFIRMPPIGSRHASAVAHLTAKLVRTAGDDAIVWSQSPMILGDYSMPQPDVMVLRRRNDEYRDALPHPGDVLLLIEVSDTTLRYDRAMKLPLYARHGIPEVWIVDLESSTLEIHRDPQRDLYAASRALARDEAVAPLAFPAMSLDWGTALG